MGIPSFAARQVYSLVRLRFSTSWPLCLLAFASLLLPWASSAQTPVLTQHNNNARTGAYTAETVLTPANVNQTSFGKLFSYPVDGRIYAQPLYVPNVSIIGKGTHNVVFIATEHDSVYAFDADSNGGSNSAPLWKITLLDSAHGAASGATTVPNGDISTADLVPEIGITGTPVIDGSTGTLYVVGKTKEGSVGNPAYFQRLHALDIGTGAEKFGGPAPISGSLSGTGTGSSGGVLPFDPKWQMNRAGLLLQNGVVYIAFGSHGDNGPWHGWVMAYNASTLQKLSTYCTSPNGFGSGTWMAGTGLAADVVDHQLSDYLERHGIKQQFGAQERILVCITPRANVHEMIETARIIAERFHGELITAYVNQPQISPADQTALDEKMAIARAAGARIEILDSENPVDALLDFARSRGITQIFIGHSQRSGLWSRMLGNPVDQLIRRSRGMDVRVFPQ